MAFLNHRRVEAALITAAMLAVASLSVLFYLVPKSYKPAYGAIPLAADQFADFYHAHRIDLPLGTYLILYCTLLAVAWLGYALLLGFLYVSRTQASAIIPIGKTGRNLSFAFIFIIAIFTPPILSSDVYAYLGYARMLLLHGLNPYSHTQFELSGLHDPVAPFLVWDVVSPYGSFWTFISTLLTWVFISGDAVIQVIGFKLLAAVSLCMIASQVSVLARDHSARTHRLGFYAVLLNPLFLIEGPGMGHNDFFLVAIIVFAVRAWSDGYQKIAAVLIGVSGAIKFFPISVLPWMWMDANASQGVDLKRFFRFGVLIMLPLLMGDLILYLTAGTSSVFDGFRAHILLNSGGANSGWVSTAVIIGLTYILLSILLLRNTPVMSWVTCLPIFGFVLGGTFNIHWPWYLVWVLGLSLYRWDRIGLTITIPAMIAAVVTSFYYSIQISML